MTSSADYFHRALPWEGGTALPLAVIDLLPTEDEMKLIVQYGSCDQVMALVDQVEDAQTHMMDDTGGVCVPLTDLSFALLAVYRSSDGRRPEGDVQGSQGQSDHSRVQDHEKPSYCSFWPASIPKPEPS